MHSEKAGHLATLAALGLLAAVLAYWTWAWLAPAPAPRAPAAVQLADRASAAGKLFGGALQGAGSTAIRLMGVVAAAGGQLGQAVLLLDGRLSVAVLEGAEVAPGLLLAEVHVDHVVLQRHGVRETLAWPEKPGR